MPQLLMHLRVLLPYQVFADKVDVARIVVETHAGSYGLWPQRFDCVASLPPGILTYETDREGEAFLAVDEGVFIKAGPEVLVSVRRAVVGSDLARLHELVTKDFLQVSEGERNARLSMARMETGFLHRFAALRHE